ncbi:MAG: ATP-binding protein [Lachnospiraceae bacterium]|nr:ATP-binding protein [Lachnospiraceae bacterium]
MREQELIVYRTLQDGELLHDMAWIMSHYMEAGTQESEVIGRRSRSFEAMRALFYDCIHRLIELAGTYGFHGNLWHCYLADLLVNNENSYSCSCEIRGEIQGSINDAVLHDIVIFKEFYDFDFKPLCRKLRVDEFSMIENYTGGSFEGAGRAAGRIYNTRICARICALAEKFCKNHTAKEMKDTLTEFYKEYGVGRFGLHKAFRIVRQAQETRIEPIRNIAHVSLNDLVGYELAKQKLVENTEAFVSGKKANNCLLYGDAGTGKSSCIKAIANEYYGRGLRIIEVYKHQFQDLNQVIGQIKNRNYKFIIYMDDLSFEEFETEYKYLKAVIEGGLERKPDNILIYATSNRRHLIRENYRDKEEIRQDMHTSDTVQEKLSLVYRFGVTIYFGAPDKKQFQGIVKALAERNGIHMPEEELLLQANKWELSHGGLSGRTAQQFIDYLLGFV